MLSVPSHAYLMYCTWQIYDGRSNEYGCQRKNEHDDIKIVHSFFQTRCVVVCNISYLGMFVSLSLVYYPKF